MTRSNAREIAMHMIFELSFDHRTVDQLFEEDFTKQRFLEIGEETPVYAQFPNEKQGQYIRALVQGTHMHSPELDGYIQRYSKDWAFSRIPRMAASIMRVCMYEILYMPDIPNAAAINSAIDIAKEYEPQEVVSFINGILGTFVRSEIPPERMAQESASEAEVF